MSLGELPQKAKRFFVVPLLWSSQVDPLKCWMTPLLPTAEMSRGEFAQSHAATKHVEHAGTWCPLVHVSVLAPRFAVAVNVRGENVCPSTFTVAVCALTVGPSTQVTAASP